MKLFLTNLCAQWAIVPLTIVLLLGACSTRPSSQSSPLPDVPVSSSPIAASPTPLIVGNPFVKGVDKAASANQLAQSAQTADDWSLVITQWQRAIAFMKLVPSSDSNHAAAQKLLVAYQQDLVRAQRQAKRGGLVQSTVAARSTDGGIPLIAGERSSAIPDSATDPATVAATTIKTLLQQQTEFFAKQKRFATSLTELGSSIADTPGYAYSTSVLPSKQAIVTATAKQDDLPSYIGTLVIIKDDKSNDTTVTAICSTSKPAKLPPDLPRVIGKEVQCPSGSAKL